jgi:hypothetical protein
MLVSMLHHVADQASAPSEARRILRVGGRMAVMAAKRCRAPLVLTCCRSCRHIEGGATLPARMRVSICRRYARRPGPTRLARRRASGVAQVIEAVTRQGLVP